MTKRLLKIAGILVALLIAAMLAIPYVNADSYGQRLKSSLERSLGRRVDIGRVRFSLFPSPGFSVGRDRNGPGVVIHEDPAIGIEPIAYVETMHVRPAVWPLLSGRFRIASIRLEDASINLTKSGSAGGAGRWNFASFVDRSVMSSVPAIHVRDGRINFKFGDTKSVFYLTETDLDISPPGWRHGGWSVYCSGQPARTDRSGHGLGSFTLQGRWFIAPERVDLDLTLDRGWLGEWTALLRGEAGAVQGTVASRLHLGGPISNIGLSGRVTVGDVHRWDLLPASGDVWPLDVRGRLDLTGQRLELESNSAGRQVLPLLVRLRASDYLTQPHWAVEVDWNRFPVAPLMGLAVHMGVPLPPGLRLTGTIDGAMVYTQGGRLQGELGFHDTAVGTPDSPPVRFEQAYLVLDGGHARLSPAVVRVGDALAPASPGAPADQAEIEADYNLDGNTFELGIHTESMPVAALRAQAALASVPWLEQVSDGTWSGDLHHHREPGKSLWTGRVAIHDAHMAVPGLSDPVLFRAARLQIDGARIVLDQIDAQAGKLAFAGEYRYEPATAHPHRMRLRAHAVDAAELETEIMPALHRGRTLLARAFGRNSLPDWLKTLAAEGTLQIDDLAFDGSHFAGVRARLRWDGPRVELDGLQAALGRAAIAGKLTIGLRGAQPVYKLAGSVKGLNWQSGKVDAEGTLETSGVGAQLLANLKSEATFSGSALDFGAPAPWRRLTGTCNLAWSPRLRLTDLSVKTAEDETFTGRGAAQEDGRLVILLSNGAREMRMTGTPANLKFEDSAK